MKIRRRTAAAVLSGAFIGGAMMIAPPAQAVDSSAAGPITAASCYGSARSYSTTYSSITGWHDWPANDGLATTTSNCSDINVRPNATERVRTCFIGGGCNSWRTISAGTWGLAATNVLDGTRFWIDFQSPSTGSVAY